MTRFAAVGCLALGLVAGGKIIADKILAEAFRQSQAFSVVQHVANSWCMRQFETAIYACNPEYPARGADKEACVKATAELRQCFAGNPMWFKHEYLWRMDHGLDQDLNPTKKEVEEEVREGFRRWWTGMRRS